MPNDGSGDHMHPERGARDAFHASNVNRVVVALSQAGPSSQAAIARLAGLSRATVHGIIHELAGDGRVEILPGATNRETTVRLAAHSGRYVVLDLGHQSIHGRLVDLERQACYDLAEAITRGNHHSHDLTAIGDLVTRLTALDDVSLDAVDGVAVTFHAPIDTAGIVAPSSIMPDWAGLNPTEKLSSYFGKPVLVENDANAAAIAEWAWGAGRGSHLFAYAKTSQGVGAGIVMDGQILRGGTGMAGEIGHIVVDPRGPLCNCGNRGCLSAVASGLALLAQFELLHDAPDSLQDLVDRALADDPVASRVITEAGNHLGVALAHVITILAPDRVAIGGEMTRAGTLHLDAVRSTVNERTVRSVAAGTEIVRGQLDGSPSLMGALLLAMRANQQDMSTIPDWIGRPVRADDRPEEETP